MLGDGVNTLTYDAAGKLITASVSGTGVGAYVYDGHGLRVQKCVPNCTSPTTKTIYIFTGSKVIAEYDNPSGSTSSPTREYIYSGKKLVAKITSSATNYYHQDHLSNRVITDSSGSVIEQLGHYPYGEPWYDTGSEKLKFSTHERDSESGNDFAMARYIVSRLGRFSSPDLHSGRLANPQSLNRYAYVLDDPINLVDPSGLDAEEAGKCINSDGDETDDDYATCIDQNGFWEPVNVDYNSMMSYYLVDENGFEYGMVTFSIGSPFLALTQDDIDYYNKYITGQTPQPYDSPEWVIDDPYFESQVVPLAHEIGNIAGPIATPKFYAEWYGASFGLAFGGLAAPEAYAALQEFSAPFANQLYDVVDFLSSVCDGCSPLPPETMAAYYGTLLGYMIQNPAPPPPTVTRVPSNGGSH
jgi:RHS repeat-associated protein